MPFGVIYFIAREDTEAAKVTDITLGGRVMDKKEERPFIAEAARDPSKKPGILAAEIYDSGQEA